MATATDSKHVNPAEQVNEAARATMEASRRTMQSTQEAVRASRYFLEESTGVSHKLFTAYTAGVTASLKAAFELQNAALGAGLSLFESAAASDREMLRQMLETLRQSEQAAMDVWQAGVQTAEKMVTRREMA
jgi:hypothetical protein